MMKFNVGKMGNLYTVSVMCGNMTTEYCANLTRSIFAAMVDCLKMGSGCLHSHPKKKTEEPQTAVLT